MAINARGRARNAVRDCLAALEVGGMEVGMSAGEAKFVEVSTWKEVQRLKVGKFKRSASIVAAVGRSRGKSLTRGSYAKTLNDIKLATKMLQRITSVSAAKRFLR